MKTLFFSLVLSVLGLAGISQTYDVTISGIVTDIDSGESVVGHPIDIMSDSMQGGYFYYNTVFTDSSGYYEDVIPVTIGVDGAFFVSTISCNEYLIEVVEFSETETEFEFDFTVCTDPVGGDCQAMFYYYPSDSVNSLTIQFMDQSIGNPTNWNWSFGDGSSSDEQNPLHTYGVDGEHLVSLSISNDNGDCQSTIDMIIWIGYDSIPNDCQAWFFLYPGDVPNSIQFIEDSWGNPTSWSWDFGDGNSSTEQNPLHIYADEGEYLVSLTISNDSLNCTSTYETVVGVFNNWPPDGCQADFYYYPVDDSVPVGDLTFQFVDISYGNPLSWSWDFGDGNTSDEQNPIHTYTEDGEYEVCLSIANPVDSCQSNFCQTISTFSDTIIYCFGWFEYTMNDMTVDFEGYLENGQTGEYTWDFGDGTTGSGATISHTYAEDGVYEVYMHVFDSATACMSEYVELVFVGDDITFSVVGHVFLADSMGMADVADVYLMTLDTMGNGLINVATTSIDASGYYEFEGVGIENCIYFVQAELTSGSDYFGEYVPTYHLNAIVWEDAWPVLPFPVDWSYDVYLQASQTLQSGSGLITGIVSEEESRGLMSDVEILLLDNENLPITYLRTNEDGQFDFPELAYGTYTVYTEIVGIETSPVTVTLDENNSVVQLNIVVANGEALLGFGDIASKYINEVSEIYPNPVSENAAVSVEMKESGTLDVTITNQFGQLVFATTQQSSTGMNKIDLKTNSLSSGFYILSIKANDDIATVRKFVKFR